MVCIYYHYLPTFLVDFFMIFTDDFHVGIHIPFVQPGSCPGNCPPLVARGGYASSLGYVDAEEKSGG